MCALARTGLHTRVHASAPMQQAHWKVVYLCVCEDGVALRDIQTVCVHCPDGFCVRSSAKHLHKLILSSENTLVTHVLAVSQDLLKCSLFLVNCLHRMNSNGKVKL